MNPETITLYYREGRSDKVYTVSLIVGIYWSVAFAYGRRGSTMTTGFKAQGTDYDKAKRIYDKLVAGKLAKGYRPSDTEISSAPVFRVGPDFELRQQVAQSSIMPQLLNECSEAKVMELIDSPHWGMQVKMDGRRQIIRKEGHVVSGYNRRGGAITLARSISDAAMAIPGNGTIDGEACGDTFHAFDMLTDGKHDLRGESYTTRYAKLSLVLAKRPGAIKLLPMALTPRDKLNLYEMAKRTKCEGVVLKLLSAPSVAGRPASGGPALKFKFYATGSFIVSKINARRSVELMTLNPWYIIGNVTIPLSHKVPEKGQVVEVRYLYCYPGGSLYQPTYLGVRDDIENTACTSEQLKYKQSDEEDES